MPPTLRKLSVTGSRRNDLKQTAHVSESSRTTYTPSARDEEFDSALILAAKNGRQGNVSEWSWNRADRNDGGGGGYNRS